LIAIAVDDPLCSVDLFLTMLGERVLKPPPQEWLRACSGPGRGLDVFVRTTHLYVVCASFNFEEINDLFSNGQVDIICSRIANVARTWIKMHYEEDFGSGSQSTTSSLTVRHI
jgi:hypothetical protein